MYIHELFVKWMRFVDNLWLLIDDRLLTLLHLLGFHLVKSSVEVPATAGINSFTLLTLQI